MKMEYILKVENLSAGYEQKVVVDHVNLTIPAGKISVIMGANGCGKSTLLKAMTRIISPQSGKVTLNGEAIHRMNPKKLARVCGMLPQTPVVPEGVTVSDLVMRGRYPHQKFLRRQTKEDLKAVTEAMEIMNIVDLADRSICELSGGQRQRVWIATALAQETEILFLDEPTTFLDMNYQVEILDLMTELNRQKQITIVMVLHDINMAARYAHYLYAMKEGKIWAEGSPKEIISREMIYNVFSIDSCIIQDPVAGTPYVVPVGRHFKHPEFQLKPYL